MRFNDGTAGHTNQPPAHREGGCRPASQPERGAHVGDPNAPPPSCLNTATNTSGPRARVAEERHRIPSRTSVPAARLHPASTVRRLSSPRTRCSHTTRDPRCDIARRNGSAEHADQPRQPDKEARFLPRLSHGRIGWRSPGSIAPPGSAHLSPSEWRASKTQPRASRMATDADGSCSSSPDPTRARIRRT